ncbi:hypothetical protein Hanom_Chr04g00325771 [Helianthus anomalus]
MDEIIHKFECFLTKVYYSFFFKRPTESIASTLETPTGQTEYSESNPSPSPIPGKPGNHSTVGTTVKLPLKPVWLKNPTQVSLGFLSLPTSDSLCTK